MCSVIKKQVGGHNITSFCTAHRGGCCRDGGRWPRTMMNGRRSAIVLLGIVPFMLVLSACRNASTKEDVAFALSYGRLAAIPTNVSSFQIVRDADYFGAYFMRFSASSSSVVRWVKDSEGLRGVTPTTLGPTYNWTPFEGDASQSRSRLDVPYVAGRETTPTWWRPTLTNSGRLFQIPGKKGCGAGGSVVVDDQNNTVYAYTRW